MKERPCIFNKWSIPKILSGSKTMTRRIPNSQNEKWEKGDVLWVKESFIIVNFFRSGENKVFYRADGKHQFITKSNKTDVAPCCGDGEIISYTDGNLISYTDGNLIDSEFFLHKLWKTCMYMPRWASRIDLKIIAELRFERLQSISIEDVIKEGTEYRMEDSGFTLFNNFRHLWNSIHRKPERQWESDPIVFVTEFKRIKP